MNNGEVTIEQLATMVQKGFEEMGQKFQEMEKKFEKKFQELEIRLMNIEADVAYLKARMLEVGRTVYHYGERLEEVEQKIR